MHHFVMVNTSVIRGNEDEERIEGKLNPFGGKGELRVVTESPEPEIKM